MTRWGMMVLVGGLFATGCAHRQSGATADICPATLPGQSEATAMGFHVVADADPPRPTTIAPGTAAALSTVRFSDGPPEEQAWLAPSEDKGATGIWRFVPSDGRQTHIACVYGRAAPMLSRVLAARTCSARFDAAGVVVALSCV